jgi:hypothetical protein
MVVLAVPLFTNVTTFILLDPAFTAPKLTRDTRALCATAVFTVRKEKKNTRRVATTGNRLISFYLSSLSFWVVGRRSENWSECL